MSSNNASSNNLVSSFNKIIIEAKALLNNILEVNFFFSNVYFPLIVVILYFLSFEFLLTPIFEVPQGVSLIFANKSWKYLSILWLGCTLIFLVIILFKKEKKLSFTKSNHKISTIDFVLLLLPLTPVIQYVINNQNILSTSASIYVVGFFVFFCSIYTFAIPLIFRFVGSTRILVTLGLAFTFSITNMALLSQNYTWYEIGTLRTQWMVLWGVFFVTWLLYSLNEKKYLHLLIAILFVTNTTSQLIATAEWKDEISPSFEENELLSLVVDREPITTPNIYLLVYDAYVANETMLGYGIDNSPQEKYLEDLGFKFYPKTYSVGDDTTWTMNWVLNASVNFYGNSRRAVSGDGIVQNALKSYGYQTYGLFPYDFFFLENPPTYDFSIPNYKSSPDILLKAILMGEFRFDVGFNVMPRQQFVETKHSIFEEISEDRVFIYMHTNLPRHSQNSGACRPDEIDLYKTRLSEANMEMQEDVKRIIANDPEAIIIVAGDHGPYLTKNCGRLEGDYDVSEISRLDIQDRFGTFLAIRWPTQDFESYDDITVIQDLFPAIFSYMFADDSLLESKIESVTISPIITVKDGIIYGGINEGEPLYISDK